VLGPFLPRSLFFSVLGGGGSTQVLYFIFLRQFCPFLHLSLRITHYALHSIFSAVIRPDLWWGQYHSNKEFFPVFLLVFILVAAVLF